MLVLAVAIPFALMALLTMQDRATGREDAQRRVAATALTAREHALRMVQAGATALDRLDDLTANLNWNQVQTRRVALQGDLRRLENQQPEETTLALVRPDGRAAVAGRADPAPLADLSGLDGIRALREGLRGLAFDPASRELFGEGAGLVVARSRAPEGRPYDGALLGVLKADAFLAEWDRLGRGEGRFALIRWDGLTLLRQGGGPLPLLATRRGTKGRSPPIRSATAGHS